MGMVYQDFVNAIKTDWSGKPIIDLQMGWKHVLKEFPEVIYIRFFVILTRMVTFLVRLTPTVQSLLVLVTVDMLLSKFLI